MTSRILQLGILMLVVSGVGVTYYAFSKTRQSVSQTPATAMPTSEPATSFSFPVHAAPKPLPALSFVDGDRQKRTLVSFKVEKFYEELSLDALAVYVDPTGSASTNLNVIGIPATLLINPQGDEMGRVLGPAEWDAPEMMLLVTTNTLAGLM